MKTIKKLMIIFLAFSVFSAFCTTAFSQEIATSNIVITQADEENTQISEQTYTDSVEKDSITPLQIAAVVIGVLCVLSVLYLVVRNIKNVKGNKNDL